MLSTCMAGPYADQGTDAFGHRANEKSGFRWGTRIIERRDVFAVTGILLSDLIVKEYNHPSFFI